MIMTTSTSTKRACIFAGLAVLFLLWIVAASTSRSIQQIEDQARAEMELKQKMRASRGY